MTQEEKNILSHVLIDPDTWVTNALATVREEAVTAKIEKYRVDYLSKKDDPNYKNRADRDAEIDANKPIIPVIETYSKLKLIKYLMANGAFGVFKQFLLDNGVDNYFLYAQDLSSDDDDVKALFPALMQILTAFGITITEAELKALIKI